MNTPQTLQYSIRPGHPGAHLFQLTCLIQAPDPDGQMVSLPAWIPGSYMIRDFAKNIVRLWAESEGVPVAVEKLDKQTWRLAESEGPLSIHYEIYAWDLSVRSAHLDTTHGYFNGTSVFLRVHGQEDIPCQVRIKRPRGSDYRNWRVATSMPRADAPLHGFGTYCADSYEELVDHPVEMGCFDLATFEANGVPHDIVITGRHRADLERLCHDLKRICEHHAAFFDEFPAMERYVFLIMAVGEGYGGLEHRTSCSLLCSRDALPREGEEAVNDLYRDFLGLCSHEYFHTWNVKRIKPAVFIPYDLSREVHTRLLWVFEGITSYYDELGLRRAGLIGSESYLQLLGQAITRVWRGSGRFKQSVSDSSFDAWTKFYKQDENGPNAVVSYYTKGSLIALSLDLSIRRDSAGRFCLDDVMRALWQRYGRCGLGLEEDGMERLIQEITGLDFTEFFRDVLWGTEDPPLEQLLAEFGVGLRMRAAESAKDKGGTHASETNRQQPVPALGLRLAPASPVAQISHVFDGGAAQNAGLAAGDTLVAMDGLRVDAANLESRLQIYRPQERVSIHAFRRDELMEFQLELGAAAVDTCYLELLPDAGAAALERRAAWLGE